MRRLQEKFVETFHCLYSEKVKAYLRRGAKPLPGFDVYPNPQVGAYGNIVSS